MTPSLSKLRTRRPDITAGLSIAGLLLPEAVAYAGIGDLPPQAGIIALFAGLLCYGVLGSSRFAIVSATSSSAIVLAAGTAAIANGDAVLRLALAFGLVLIAGAFFLLAWILRLGSLTDFVAKPVLSGFSFGLAVVIILHQCAGVIGVHPVHPDVLRFVAELLGAIERWNWMGIAVCGCALALLFIFSRWRRWPGGLIVIALGVLAGHWLNLQQYGVGVVGEIHFNPTRPTLPYLSQSEWLRLIELGGGMVLVLYAESYGAVRSLAIKHGDTMSPERDLLALGAANLLSGLFQGMPVGAGFSATSANEAAGACSRMAGIAAAAVVGAIVLTLLPAIASTPLPVLAAVVIHAVSHTLRPAIFTSYFRWHRDRLVLVAAVLGVFMLGVLDGMLAAVAISLILMLRRLSGASISVLGQLGQSHDYVKLALHPDAHLIPNVTILRPDEPLFFANAERILNSARVILAQGPPVHSIIISLEESPDLDGTSLEALLDFFDFACKHGQRVILARLKEPAHDVLDCAIQRRFVDGSAVTTSGPVLSEFSVAAAVASALLAQHRASISAGASRASSIGP